MQALQWKKKQKKTKFKKCKIILSQENYKKYCHCKNKAANYFPNSYLCSTILNKKNSWNI